MPDPEEGNPAGGLAGLVGVVKKAFNGVISTMSETGGVKREDVDKAYNSIQKEYMDSVHAMRALKPGHGQHLIKGDDIHFVSGNRIAGIHGNDLLRVNGEQSHEIDGNAVFLYNGTRDQETKLDEAWVVMGTRKCYVMGESEDNFFGKHDQHAPETFEWKYSESTFVANQIDKGILIITRMPLDPLLASVRSGVTHEPKISSRSQSGCRSSYLRRHVRWSRR